MTNKKHAFSKQKHIEFLADQYAKEFKTPTPTLKEISVRFLSYTSDSTLSRAANNHQIPFPIIKMGGKKSPYLVSVMDLAEYVFSQSETAKRELIYLS